MADAPLTDTDWQRQVVATIGDTPDERVAQTVNRLWRMYADLAGQPRLRYYQVLREAVQLEIGAVNRALQAAQDPEGRGLWETRLRGLELAYTWAEAGITAEQAGVAPRYPVVGQQSTTAPTSPPPGFPNANDPRYTGSPYRPPGKVQW